MVATMGSRIALVCAFAAALVFGVAPTPVPVHAQTAGVSIQGFSFQPATMTVAVGTTVTWTNNDSVPHTATSDSGGWDSGTISPGMSFHYTFSTAGTFPYHCMIHPYMHGTIMVQGTSPSPQPQPQPQPRPQSAMAVTVTPSTVTVGQTATVQGADFTPNNVAFVFWQRPDRTSNGVWVTTSSSGTFALTIGFSPRHGIGSEFVTAFDRGRQVWAPFATVTVVGAPIPGPGQLFASPNPVVRGGTTVILGRGFTPRSVVMVQWRRPNGIVATVRVATDATGSFAFRLFADPRNGCGPRAMVVVDLASGRASSPLTLGEIC